MAQIGLAVHGGAGTIPAQTLRPEVADALHEGLRAALAAGLLVLKAGGPALDAVCAAVMVLEDDSQFNSAHGAVFTAAGRMEMDAALMEGHGRRAGAVAGICGPRNPILAARAVMEASGNVLLIGQAAEEFARAEGLVFMDEAYFSTPSRRAALALELARRASGAPDTRSDADRHGTVGAVARDQAGHLAAGTSTGGLTAKRPGRVGDTPVFGAGTFAEDASCAVSATGTGEVFIRFTAASEIAARVKYAGQSLEQAAFEVIAELASEGGDGGLIAIGAHGPAVMPFNCAGMYRGCIGADGSLLTAIHNEPFRVRKP
ncbi:MAG: beta-aspartyl-peptidase [Rhodospirillales bacterium 20-60-12]|nr:MAG: beta-aspartyl-peptidase [Rhodospirillales bacterium 20-60-12]HQT67889.1 isoaspartyl peptidase/L-asparaginase [Acetobacteraceae bacterium]